MRGGTLRKELIAVLVLLALVVLGCTQQSAPKGQDSAEAQAAAKVAPNGVTNPQKNYLSFQQEVPGTVVGVLPVKYGYFVSVAKDANVQNPKVYREVVSTQKYTLGQPVDIQLNVQDKVVGLSA